jgi:hypothetical protein
MKMREKITTLDVQKPAEAVLTNHDILDKVLKDTQLTGLSQLAARLKLQPHLLNAVYNGRLDLSKGLAHAINALYPQITVKWLLSGVSKVKTPEEISQPAKAGRKKAGRKKIKLQQPETLEAKPIKQPVERKVVKKVTVEKTIEPVKPVEKPVATRKRAFKLPVKPAFATRQQQSSSNLNALLSNHETLISNMDKLVDIHLDLVETVIKMITK